MNISIPDPMRQYVEEQVQAGGYGSVSEYVRELVRADQKSKARGDLEEVLLEALRSGEPYEVTPRMWKQLRQRVRERAKKRGPAKG